jgi:hypothetical protein
MRDTPGHDRDLEAVGMGIVRPLLNLAVAPLAPGLGRPALRLAQLVQKSVTDGFAIIIGVFGGSATTAG